MTTEITGKNFEKISPAVREKIDEKFSKLDKFNVQFIKNHILIEKDSHGVHTVEVTSSIPGSTLQASSSKDNLYATINDVFHKLERQLNKHQHKSESRRVSNGEKAKQMEINIENRIIEESNL